ncbi:TetR family transcriptional regulator [Prescottella soli]|uniref:TetR family transcriptional regulator n=1 Tax=Prescottella soli TaxID=1543852 RepID=A0ABW9G115_9NOCA
MGTDQFQRARSPQAKLQRELAILEAARRLATENSVREVTLTEIAAVVGMHKSAMLRYFETREEIFLRIAGTEWRDWSDEVCSRLSATEGADGSWIAELLVTTLLERPMFCDLLVQAPLNLEKNVSLDSVRQFKLRAIAANRSVAVELQRVAGLDLSAAVDVVTVATSMAGALWQMAEPGPRLREFYRSDPQLSHAIVEVAPRLRRTIEALVAGFPSTEPRWSADD